MEKLGAVIVAIIASAVIAGTAAADQTTRDQQMEFESEYLDNGE